MSALKEVLALAEKWPADVQEELVKVALTIERNQNSDFEFDNEDWKIIEERMASSARGEFATEAEMEELFAKYRLP